MAIVGQLVLFFPENGSSLRCNGVVKIPGIVQLVLPDSINLVVFPMCNCCKGNHNLFGIKFRGDVEVGGFVPSDTPYWDEVV